MLHKPTLETAPRRVTGRRRYGNRRRGIATLWTILFIPAILLLFIIAVEAGYLWLSRVELENALEAAALAAVKEWGDANGGSTLVPRQIGQEYAAANTINAVPVAINLNYDPANVPNENDRCDFLGNLVFGAITNEDYQCGDPVVFNAGVAPSCGPMGTVLFDATGNLHLGHDAAWGIAFLRTVDTPPNLTILSVTIDLQAGTDPDAVFDFTTSGPVLSDSLPDPIILGQLDVSGFTDPGAQIAFSPILGTSPTLTIDFGPDPGPGGDLGFEPCDRIRFGALTDDLGKGWYNDEGDGVGVMGVQVTVVFALNGVPQAPVTATYVDNTETSNDCVIPYTDPLDPYICSPEHLIEHPIPLPDLPCPWSSATNNNGQSYVLLEGGGGHPFAVRAQATVEVPGLICWFCELPIGPFSVSACSTAMYDCIDQRPRLVRVEEFICPGP